MTGSSLDEKWWKVSKEEEYRKNKKLKESDVKIIKEWIEKEPHLPKLNDNQIIMFLRACDYSLELSKKSIDLNYTMRTKHPEFFIERDPENKSLKELYKYLDLAVLPPNNDDDIIIVCNVHEEICNILTKHMAEEAVKLTFMMHDMSHMEFGSCNGFIYIIDMKFMNLSLLLRLPIQTIGNMLKFWQDCSTYKIKAFHIINGSHIFKRILPLFQQFLKMDIFEVIYVHDNINSLKKSLASDNLPSNYEGNAESVKELAKKSAALLNNYTEWFQKEEQQKADEKKRISGKSNVDCLKGSFKKLDID